MMDWGIALSVGLAVALISELTILAAVIMPKIPLEPGKTWRGTVSTVSVISLIVGGVGGYVAGQFGGRGGGGATVPGQSPISTQTSPHVPVSTQTVKTEATKPARPDSYLASTVDMYFVRDKESKIIAWTCEMVGYRRKGSAWELVIKRVVAKDIAEFLKLQGEILDSYLREIPSDDQAGRKLRIFRDPDPGDGTYQQIRQQAEKQGWKVDRKDVTWQPEYPQS